MARLPCLALLALLLGLAGCSTTVFESLPAGTTTDCDPAWPGRWQPVGSSNDAMKPDGVVEIAADCRSAVTKGEQTTLDIGPADTGTKAPWPKTLPEQIAAVRNAARDRLLAQTDLVGQLRAFVGERRPGGPDTEKH